MTLNARSIFIAIYSVISLSILTFYPVGADARDWFVRQYGEGYGKKDGTTYLDAWNGLDQVVWGTTGVKAGDTLWVCGLHDTPAHNQLVVKASGTDAARIEIRGDYPSDPGTIWYTAYKFIGTTNWTSAGYGAYKLAYWGSSTSLVENGSLFASLASTPPNATWQNGNIFYDSANKLLYYRPYSALTADSKIYILSGNGAVLMQNVNYVTLRNIFIRGCTDAKGAVCIIRSNNITLDGIDIMHAFFGVSVSNNSDTGVVKNSKISNCGDGVYLISNDNTTNNNYWKFENNNISDITNKIFKNAPDQHGIGIQGGKGHLVVRNIFRNSATGVTLYCGDGQEGTIEIANNYASDIYILPSTGNGPTYGHGFAYDYHGTKNAGTVEIVIHHNIAVLCENGAIRCSMATRADILNNTLDKNGIGIFVAGNPPRGKVMNNIVAHAIKYNVYLVGTGMPNTFEILLKNNNYYPMPLDKNVFYYQSYNPYGAYTYDNWKQMVPGNEFGSLITDPRFISSDPQEANQYKLSKDSPAINSGETIPGILQDFSGSPYPVSVGDIGAFENNQILNPVKNIQIVVP